jgi:hypothetical protein
MEIYWGEVLPRGERIFLSQEGKEKCEKVWTCEILPSVSRLS